MDIHSRIAAALHIASGTLLLLMLAVVTLFFAGFAALLGFDRHAVGILVAFLVAVTGIFAVMLSVAQIVAAICFLRGSPSAKAWLIVLSALALLNFPIGTTAGVYSLWALLRSPPNDQVA